MKNQPIKLCINCKHIRTDPNPDKLLRHVARCHSPHQIVVGDGEEGGGIDNACWRERAVGDPTQYSFHCGPGALFFEPKTT